jgi:hypothetical protein
MKKTPSLFKRDWHGDRLAYDVVTPGCEWVQEGEGIATAKLDGTACMVRDGVLFKRYNRKASKKHRKSGQPITADMCKAAPDGWIPCEAAPDPVSGHWPGWVPVGDEPASVYHREAWATFGDRLPDGTYELIGPAVQGNPHCCDYDILSRHGGITFDFPRNFQDIKAALKILEYEGIVWHHPDGRMAKIKRKDFGFPWPLS